MKNKINVLHISPDFNYVCGVSKYIYLLFKEFRKYEDLNLFFVTNGGESLERLENLGYKPILMNFRKGWKNIFYFYQNLKLLEEFCRRNEIHIIHTHHRYPELLANLIKRKLQIKTITTVHSLVDGYKSISFKSDLIIAVSKSVKENIENKFGVQEEKIIQFYNPLDFEELEEGLKSKPNFNFEFPVDAKIFLFIGRWTKIKGVDLLIKTFLEIFKKYKNVFLIIISDIPKNEKRKLQHLNKNFILIDAQKNIHGYFNIADVVVLPSRIEPFPFVMLEAGYYKKLFIGANTGGIGEFIENGVDGLLFELGKNINLEKLINDVLDNKYQMDLLAENLHKKVIREIPYTKIYVDKLIKIYKSLLFS
jgi:glycosyltransferase involved in cell wall biosynthesis